MSKVLEMAKQLDATYNAAPTGWTLYKDAAAELRRLHELNAELVAALEEIAAEEWRDDDDPILDRARGKARAAIAKAKSEQKPESYEEYLNRGRV